MAGNRRHAGGMKSAMQNLRKIDEQIAEKRQAERRTEPLEPVSDEMVLRLAREAQSRIDASVGAPSMVVGCYTLAALCAEVALFRAKESPHRPDVCPLCGDCVTCSGERVVEGTNANAGTWSPCPTCIGQQPGSGRVVKVSIEAEAEIEASLRYSDPVAQRAFIKGYVRAATLHKRRRSILAAYRNPQPAGGGE